MSEIQLVFRVLDSDIHNLKRTDQILNRLVRQYQLNAKVIQVSEILEFGRLGIADRLPVLELNGVLISTNSELSEDLLRNVFEKIAAVQNKANSPKK